MFGLFKRFAAALVLIAFLAMPCFADRIGILASEGDGNPSNTYAYAITFPNGTISIVNGVLTYTPAAGAGDVTGVGDCASGACGDGTSDGGTYYRLYDGTANYLQLAVSGALGGDLTLNLDTLLSTGSPQFTAIELGHATDTTIARSGAGAITVEGVAVLLSGGPLGTPASGSLDPDFLTGDAGDNNLLDHEIGGLEADISACNGHLTIASGATTCVQDAFNQAAAPDANDDSGSGYSVGSLWYDTTADVVYLCIDATAAAAVWQDISSSSATALDDVGNPDANASITMAGFSLGFTSGTDGWNGVTIETTVADNAAVTTLLTLQSADANDPTNTVYLDIIEGSAGTPVSLFTFKGRTLTLGTGASIEGLGALSLGGIVLGDTTPDADGEIGYASNAFLGFANSEDYTLTASANLWTFASNTSATFAFTPAVAFTGGIGSIGAASDLSGAVVTLGTVAGAIDAGGATSVEVPNGANPTTNVAGEIAVDSSAGAGQGVRAYAAAAFTLPAWQPKCSTIAGATASSDYMVEQLPYAVTIQRARVTQRGATNVVGHFDECDSAGASCAGIDGATDITATTTATDDGTLSNPTIDANDVIQWHTTSVSGTNTDLIVCIYYTVDQVD